MAFLDFIFGRPAKRVERDLYEPGQRQLLGNLTSQVGNLLPMGLGNLQNILGNNQEDYERYTRPAITDLEQRILPGVAERFTGTYGPGSFRSSAFGQEIGQQVTNLEQNLISNRYDRQQQALQQLMQLLNPALIQTRGFYNRPRQPGLLENLAVGLLGNLK